MGDDTVSIDIVYDERGAQVEVSWDEVRSVVFWVTQPTRAETNAEIARRIPLHLPAGV